MAYVTAIYGGPEKSPANALVPRLDQLLNSIQEPDGTGQVQFVYHVEGSLLGPEYQGVRQGPLSRRERIVQVQMAVPRSVLRSPLLPATMLGLLLDAVGVAEVAFSKAKIPFHTSAYVAGIAEAAKALGVELDRGPDVPPVGGDSDVEDTVELWIPRTSQDVSSDLFTGLQDELDTALRSEGIGWLDGNEIDAEYLCLLLVGKDLTQLAEKAMSVARRHALPNGSFALLYRGLNADAERRVQLS